MEARWYARHALYLRTATMQHAAKYVAPLQALTLADVARCIDVAAQGSLYSDPNCNSRVYRVNDVIVSRKTLLEKLAGETIIER